ncbi:MAG: SRPBCC family protein [Actinomycetota bacterium]|nr:SRPBCC family protein [Actinomycetota bacterium]
MGPISIKIEVGAPRERVFDLVCDLSRRPTWTDHFASGYRLERIEASGAGAAARFRAGAPGGIDYMEMVISEAERPARIVEEGRGGRLNRIPIHAVWELSEDGGSSTGVSLTFATEPSEPLDRLRDRGAERWWRRRWTRALERLKQQLESGDAAPEPVGVAGGARQPLDSRHS